MTHENTHTSDDLLRRLGSRLERRFNIRGEKDLQYESKRQRLLRYLHSGSFRDVMKNFIIRPLEVSIFTPGRWTHNRTLMICHIGCQHCVADVYNLCTNSRRLSGTSPLAKLPMSSIERLPFPELRVHGIDLGQRPRGLP